MTRLNITLEIFATFCLTVGSYLHYLGGTTPLVPNIVLLAIAVFIGIYLPGIFIRSWNEMAEKYDLWTGEGIR